MDRDAISFRIDDDRAKPGDRRFHGLTRIFSGCADSQGDIIVRFGAGVYDTFPPQASMFEIDQTAHLYLRVWTPRCSVRTAQRAVPTNPRDPRFH